MEKLKETANLLGSVKTGKAAGDRSKPSQMIIFGPKDGFFG